MEQTMTGMDFKIREVAGRIRELREISGFTVEEMARRTEPEHRIPLPLHTELRR